MPYRIVGKPLPRVEASAKATGEAKFTADITIPRALVGAILGSPYAHARILNVDASRATRLAGVKGIVTGDDCKGVLIGQITQDQPPLARHKVRFVGEPVAAVAAVDLETALEALELIRVDYEELPSLFDPLDALRPDAPLIHENLPEYATSAPSQRYGNVCAHVKVHRGNVEEALAQADYVFEDEYTTQVQHQGYIEPHAAAATIDSSGKVTVWATSKTAFTLREDLVKVLGLPMSKVRVIIPCVGGDFGGKGATTIEPVAALLATKCGRSVKLELGRRQDFSTAHPRHPITARLKIGVKADGTVMAIQGEWIVDAGAYADTGPRVASKVCDLQGAYRVDNVRMDSRCVYTNKLSFGNCRAPGTPQACFAIESAMDSMAAKLGLDPLAIRLKNVAKNGDISATGQELHEMAAEETLLVAGRESNWEQNTRRPNRGRGVAIGQWHSGSGPSSALVKINEDGTVVLVTGVVEQGGGCHTILAQVVAESLSVSVEDVAIVASDTDATPFEGGTGASRTTFTAGKTVKLAAEDARRQLLAVAATLLEASEADVELDGRRAYVKGAPDRSIGFSRLVAANRSGPIIGLGSHARKKLPYDPSATTGSMATFNYGHVFASEVADVEVDPETGQVKVLEVAVAQDVGFAMNPLTLSGQLEGGLATGLGFALTEELVIENGRPVNPMLTDYRLLTAMDMPSIHESIVEVPSEEGPFGAKGAGETTNVPTAAAVANAVYDAVGVRIKNLPITPEKVYWALKERRRG